MHPVGPEIPEMLDVIPLFRKKVARPRTRECRNHASFVDWDKLPVTFICFDARHYGIPSIPLNILINASRFNPPVNLILGE